MASKFLTGATLGLGLALAACGGGAAPASSAAPPSAAAPVSAVASAKPAASAASAAASGAAAASKPAAASGAASASAKPAASTGANAAAGGKVMTLGISQLFPHPVLDTYRKGFTDELAAQGFTDAKLKIDYQNSQGDINIAKTIADKFVSDKDDLIFCITTPSCLSASKATTTIPVIFGYVTDPVAAGIVKDAQHPGGNVTGVTALNRVTDQLKLMKEIVPNVKNVGTVWNPGEANSRVLVASMKTEGAASGYNIVEATASSSGEVPTAAKSLIGKVDAIFITGDNTAQAALPAIVKLGEDNKVPVFTSDYSSVKQGAVATYNFLEDDLGKQTADMTIRVLKGDKPGDIAVEGPKNFKVIINPGAAAKMGIKIPDSVTKKADVVIQ